MFLQVESFVALLLLLFSSNTEKLLHDIVDLF